MPSFRVIASGCQAYHHVILVPKGVFNPTYPPGITPPEATDTAGLIVWRCQQAIVGESVVQSFQLGYFAGGISNPDSSQGNASYHRYAFQVYTNSPALAENATRRYGLSFVQAPTVTVKETPLPNGGRLIEYDYPPGMDHYKISGMAHDTSGRGAQTGAFYYANETNLRRFFLFQDSTIASGNDGVLEFGPGSYWANHSSTRHMETAINTYGDAYIEVRFDETFVRPS